MEMVAVPLSKMNPVNEILRGNTLPVPISRRDCPFRVRFVFAYSVDNSPKPPSFRTQEQRLDSSRITGLHQAGIFDAFGKLNLQVAMNGVVLHIAGLNGWQMKQWFLISGFAFSYWCLDFCSNQSLLSL